MKDGPSQQDTPSIFAQNLSRAINATELLEALRLLKQTAAVNTHRDPLETAAPRVPQREGGSCRRIGSSELANPGGK